MTKEEKNANINWFPGHMAKALREIKEQVKSIDIILELVDARAPLGSRNPQIQEIIGSKPHLTILTKVDLASQEETDKWGLYFKNKGMYALTFNLAKFDYNQLKKICKEALKEKFAKDAKKGLRPRPIRALIVGIPNVGKSSLINKLAKRKAANVENRPGVTKAQQFIKIDQDFILLDTPGVLWPNFEDKQVATNLALIGTIKRTILPLDFLCLQLLKFLTISYPGSLNRRYDIEEIEVKDEKDADFILKQIADKRGFIKDGNIYDYERTINTLLVEFADGNIGRFSLEKVSDYNG